MISKLKTLSSGTNWSLYTPFNYEAHALRNTTPINVVSVNGEGYLYKAIIYGSYNQTIKVYIDGVLKHYSNANNGTSDTPIGIIQENMLKDYGNGASATARIGFGGGSYYIIGTVDYPYTAGAANGLQLVSLPIPIHFKTSLVVEYTGNSSADGYASVIACYK